MTTRKTSYSVTRDFFVSDAAKYRPNPLPVDSFVFPQIKVEGDVYKRIYFFNPSLTLKATFTTQKGIIGELGNIAVSANVEIELEGNESEKDRSFAETLLYESINLYHFAVFCLAQNNLDTIDTFLAGRKNHKQIFEMILNAYGNDLYNLSFEGDKWYNFFVK